MMNALHDAAGETLDCLMTFTRDSVRPREFGGRVRAGARIENR